MMRRRRVALGVACLVGLWGIVVMAQEGKIVPYVPTPYEVVQKMLEMAHVTKDDYVIDIGCGDGRIVVMAAQKFGARGLGVDIDEERVRDSLENVKKAKVEHLVKIRRENLFRTDLREATVVTMYLLSDVNLMVRPKLFRELKPGTRVVSHDFDMDEWEPDRTEEVRADRSHTIYYWVMPAGVAGVWRWTDNGQVKNVLHLEQHFQKVSGVYIRNGKETKIEDAKLVGSKLSFTVTTGSQSVSKFKGTVNGDTIKGTIDNRQWMAKRDPVKLVGTWRWKQPARSRDIPVEMRIQRDKIGFVATCFVNGREIEDKDGDREKDRVRFIALGASIHLEITGNNTSAVVGTYRGHVEGDTINGTFISSSRAQAQKWSAKRAAQ